jgi:hypothetical protein
MNKILSNLTKQLDSAFFGSFFELCRAKKLLEQKIQKCEENQFESDLRLELPDEKHNYALSESIERIERIEDKASRSLLGITLAFAVLGAVSRIDGALDSQSMWVRISAAALLMLAMSYLFGSGLLALQAYKNGPIYSPTLHDFISERPKQAMAILYCIEQNHSVGTLRSNLLIVSFRLIRNGIGAILLLGFLIIIVDLLS